MLNPFVTTLLSAFFFCTICSKNAVAMIDNETGVVIAVDAGKSKLYGSLLLPVPSDNNNPVDLTVALIIGGSGPTDRNGNSPTTTNNHLKFLAQGLAESGVASLRYDKRGIAESKAAGPAEQDLRFEQYIDDAVSWLRFLQADKRFKKLVVIGHSEGSLIGMIAASRGEADRFISLAGAGRRADQIIKEQLSAQPVNIRDTVDHILNELVQGNTVEDVDPMFNALFRPSVQPYMISWLNYNPVVELAQLDIPVLLLQGTTDIQVSTKDAALLASSQPAAELILLEGMNHILKSAAADRAENIATYNNPDLPITAELIESIVAFVVK